MDDFVRGYEVATAGADVELHPLEINVFVLQSLGDETAASWLERLVRTCSIRTEPDDSPAYKVRDDVLAELDAFRSSSSSAAGGVAAGGGTRILTDEPRRTRPATRTTSSRTSPRSRRSSAPRASGWRGTHS
jgi:hypothetical protein